MASGAQGVAGLSAQQANYLENSERTVRTRQAQRLQEDIHAIQGVDVNAPFRNLGDAINRLLPFHVSATTMP
jgi:hypothetical protein